MTDFLNALKTDLSDRRLLPFVALVGVALLAAIGYVIVGGGSSSSSTPTATVAPVTASAPPSKLGSVSQTSTEKPAAETTEGTNAQHRGIARDPFVALPVKTSKAAAAVTPTTGGGSTPTTGGSSTTTTPKGTTPSKPSTPAKPKTVYHVAVLFGVIPAGTDPQAATLTPYENLKLLTPLPSAKLPLIVYRGVTTAGHSATFTVVGEAILRGSASCLPNASQCAAIDLRPGQSEQLEYLPPSGGPSVLYELRVVTIAASKAHAGSVKSVLGGISKAGREVLRRSGLVAIPYLHYSKQLGVLAFSSHPTASAARAHGARRFDSSR
jgi:hypothetical protein